MMGSDRQLWSGMLAHLEAQHAALCRRWFSEIKPLGIDGGVLRLRAQTNIHRDYLQRQCADAFNDAARTASERLLAIQFLGPEDEIERARPPAAMGAVPASPGADHVSIPLSPLNEDGFASAVGINGSAAAGGNTSTSGSVHEVKPNGVGSAGVASDHGRSPDAGQVTWELTGKPTRPPGAPDPDRGYSLVINPDYTFENFVVGPNNRLAHAAAVAVAANPGRAYNPYFVHGDVGLGKTHLLQAICLRIMELEPGARIFYTSCEGFMTQFMDAVQAGEMGAFRHRFRDVDLLVIDDVHFLAKRDRTQEEFFHTFNTLYQAHKQIVLSSDAPPEEIPDLEDRLVSRFKWGLVTSVAPPAYETRIEILKNKARMRGFNLTDDVACHIAARVDSNIRELEGVITKLHVLSAVEKRSVDLGLAALALGEEPGRSDKQVQIQTIIDTVTEFYGVKMTDLQSKRRQRSIALPRQICMYLARKLTRFSLEEIGGYFGGRDHTTVMHAVRTVEDRCGLDADFTRVIQTLETQLKTASVA